MEDYSGNYLTSEWEGENGIVEPHFDQCFLRFLNFFLSNLHKTQVIYLTVIWTRFYRALTAKPFPFFLTKLGMDLFWDC